MRDSFLKFTLRHPMLFLHLLIQLDTFVGQPPIAPVRNDQRDLIIKEVIGGENWRLYCPRASQMAVGANLVFASGHDKAACMDHRRTMDAYGTIVSEDPFADAALAVQKGTTRLRT